MPKDKEKLIHLKAAGIQLAIERMSEHARTEPPSQEVVTDYNRLIDLAKEYLPEYVDVLPPQMDTYVGAGRDRRVYGKGTYSDIMIFAAQVREITSG